MGLAYWHEYVPNTAQVRYACVEYYSPERFDRWLAGEIRKAKAEAWDEGYEAGCEDMENATINPYKEES